MSKFQHKWYFMMKNKIWRSDSARRVTINPFVFSYRDIDEKFVIQIKKQK